MADGYNHTVYMRTWRAAHRDDVNARKRASYRDRHSEAIRARVRAHAAAHPEVSAAYREANRELRREQQSAWRKANPQKVQAQIHRRRARLVNAAGADYTTEVHIAGRWAMYGGRCRYCGDTATCTDHRIPLARGGSHFPANLVPACGSCNSSKRVSTESEFLARSAA